jgi:hypothetical protein
MKKSGWRVLVIVLAALGCIAGIGGFDMTRAAPAAVEAQASGAPAGASLAQKMFAPALANDELRQVAESPTPTKTVPPAPTPTRPPAGGSPYYY